MWGNSLAVRIPSEVARAALSPPGQPVDVRAPDSRDIIWIDGVIGLPTTSPESNESNPFAVKRPGPGALPRHFAIRQVPFAPSPVLSPGALSLA